MADINVTGLAELQAFLDTLPAKVEQNILRGALRAGAKPILEDAKAGAQESTKTGLMRDGLKITTKAKKGTVTVSIKAGGKHAYLAKFVEFGTAAHRIDPKNGGVLSFGGGFARHVDHPGQRAKPFLRPAFDAQSENAVVATGEYIKKRLSSKEGIDTSDVTIEAEK